MNFERPLEEKTSEEIAALEKSRAISDVELLKEGAEYKIDKESKKRLELTQYQVNVMEQYNRLKDDEALKKIRKELGIKTPEEISEIEMERTLSDAELLKEGAKYRVDEQGRKNLELTNIQMKMAKLYNEDIILEPKMHKYILDVEKGRAELITLRNFISSDNSKTKQEQYQRFRALDTQEIMLNAIEESVIDYELIKRGL